MATGIVVVIILVGITLILLLACMVSALRQQSMEIRRLRSYLRNTAAPHRIVEIEDDAPKHKYSPPSETTIFEPLSRKHNGY